VRTVDQQVTRIRRFVVAVPRPARSPTTPGVATV
jgi:hypothetical protein